MLEGISERVQQQLSEGSLTTGISTGKLPDGNDLLIAVIVLGIIVFALIVIIIYGYCKYVRGGRRKKMEENTSDVEKPPAPPTPPQTLDQQPGSTMADIPVKTRKRSMTFSETDEECRRYREDLADSYTGAKETPSSSSTGAEPRSRKKSVVTFAGVEEIDFHADPTY